MDRLEEPPVLLCGRDFTRQELREIQETIELFPKLSRYELANTICEHLAWVAPNGRYKTWSCLQFLQKLEAHGVARLPARKGVQRGKERVIPSSRTDACSDIVTDLANVEPLELEPVRIREEIQLWNEYIQRYHMLGYKRPFGAHQRYFIVSRAGDRLGCLLFAASAWALAARDEWIGWTENDRSKRLNLVVNNTRFLIFPWVRIKNLASKALSLAGKRIPSDWQARYGYRPVLLETFVDAGQYRGTCYQAASWILVGGTAGRGRMDRWHKQALPPKLIYVYPLVADFRTCLRGEVGR